MKIIKTVKPQFPPARILTGMSEGIYPCFGDTPYVRKVGMSREAFVKYWENDALSKVIQNVLASGTGFINVSYIRSQDIFDRQRLLSEVQTKLKEQVYVHPFLNTHTEE